MEKQAATAIAEVQAAEQKVAAADKELQHVEKSISKAKSARWKDFGAKAKERMADTALGAKPKEEEKSLAQLTEEQEAEHAKKASDAPEEKTTKVEPPAKAEEKKKGFVQTQKEQAAQAALEAADFKKKYEESEAARTAWETEKADLTRKLEEATSNSEIAKLQEQLREKEKYVETVSTDKTKLEQRLEVLDTINSPTFIQKYTQPVQQAFKAVTDILNTDPDAMSELSKAINAQEAAMAANTPEEKLRQENLRDMIVNGIYENLIPSKQARFNDMFYTSLVPKQEAYFNALANSQQTVAEIRKENDRLRIEQQTNFKNTWSGAFEKAGQALNAEITYPDEVAKVIKENKIDDSVDGDMAIAKDLIMGGTKYPPEESARIMVQGANANRYKAQLAAKDVMIAELNETIKKFRGTSTTGSKSAETSKEAEEKDKPVKGSRDWALAKWGTRR